MAGWGGILLLAVIGVGFGIVSVVISRFLGPRNPTPEKLAAYAKTHRADESRWNHVTGALIDITAVSEQFGLQFWRATPTEPINHNVRTVVVDAAGHVQWVTPDNDFKSDAFVEQMIKAAQARPPAAK